MATTLTTGTGRSSEVRPDVKPGRHWRPGRLNWFGGSFGWIWLLIVMVPIYWIVITSFKEQSSYFGSNPLAPPTTVRMNQPSASSPNSPPTRSLFVIPPMMRSGQASITRAESPRTIL